MSVITIDGPAAAGKTTSARALAENLTKAGKPFLYVDTGAFYRITAKALRKKYGEEGDLPLDDIHLLDGIGIGATNENGIQTMCFDSYSWKTSNRTDIPSYMRRCAATDQMLRTPAISQDASRVSTVPAVRALVNRAIRDYAGTVDCVMEGRDTGSVICPNAKVKFYLTADIEARAKRRQADLFNTMSYEELVRDISERDRRDTERKADPLKVPDGAVWINNSDLSIAQVNRLLFGIAVHMLG